METILKTSDELYGKLICNYLQREFPLVFPKSKADLLEIITDLLVGTKETRYGPAPKPEVLVKMREIIKAAVEVGDPIPVLVAWGGRKTNPASIIDVAEVSALKSLITLDQRIRQHYGAGLNINIRIEDTGAYWLYRHENVDAEIKKYSTDFTKLVNILRGTSRLNPIEESTLMDKDTYFDKSLVLSGLLEAYLIKTDAYGNLGTGEEFRALNSMGWKGVIPVEQRNFYRNRYTALYPNVDAATATKYLADYLAGAKVRYDMNGRGAPAKDYIGISFVQPVPGAPESLFNTTLYNRTLPLSEAKTHMPAWRSKGYLKIGEDNQVKAKITSFSDMDIIEELHQNVVTLQHGLTTVDVQVDYLLV